MIAPIVTNCVHVFCSAALMSSASRETLTSGGQIFELDLENPRTEDQLVQRFFHAFHDPRPASGLDAVLARGSELYWLTGNRTFLVLTSGLDNMAPELSTDFCNVVIRIVDRMRVAGDRYTVMFPASASTDELLAQLRAANESLTVAPTYPWIRQPHPVPVIDHRNDAPLDE